ncbi:epithelial membrane protein 3 isoform X2 [Ciconia boyciana]|uniref:epithelial membrane protein 3 isoform X2 n=1 Tax=Ciconia boyciana TaxID=52775 RepID=UPI003BA0D6EB
MSFLLFAVAALHVLILLLLFVITLDKGWWVLPDAEKLNLWYDCVFQNSTQSWLCASVANSPARGAPRAPLRRLGRHPAAGGAGGAGGGGAVRSAGGAPARWPLWPLLRAGLALRAPGPGQRRHLRPPAQEGVTPPRPAPPGPRRDRCRGR